MRLRKQHTIKQACTFEGIGIHSGLSATVKVSPAPPDHGITFYSKGMLFKASAINVIDCKRCTVIGNSHCRISTVEHLLAAAYGLGLDNLKIEVDGPEIPILDGSAAPFARKFIGCGIIEQNSWVNPITLKRPLVVYAGDSFVAAYPSSTLTLDYSIFFEHPMVGFQSIIYDHEKDDFLTSLAPARTFGFREEVENLLAEGLAKGGNLENAIVIDRDGYSSPLHFPDELVRHKCLDLLGDLALVNGCLKARIVALKAGHRLHIKLVQRIIEELPYA